MCGRSTDDDARSVGRWLQVVFRRATQHSSETRSVAPCFRMSSFVRRFISHGVAGLVGGVATYVYELNWGELGRFERLLGFAMSNGRVASIEVPHITLEAFEHKVPPNADGGADGAAAAATKKTWHSLGLARVDDGGVVVAPLTAVPEGDLTTTTSSSEGSSTSTDRPPRTLVIEDESWSDKTEASTGWSAVEGLQFVIRDGEGTKAFLVRMFTKKNRSETADRS